MRLSIIVCLVMITVFLCGQTDAWWGSRSSSSSSEKSEGSKSVVDRVKSVGRKIGKTAKETVKSAKDGAKFAAGFAKGSYEMGKAYVDMRTSNWKKSDKYFHARGNYDAAKHGPGGKAAAKVISDTRETVQQFFGESKADSDADQAANEWGRSGKDPNKFRPKGLPKKY